MRYFAQEHSFQHINQLKIVFLRKNNANVCCFIDSWRDVENKN